MWKQSKCPSTNEWIKKVGVLYIHKYIYLSVYLPIYIYKMYPHTMGYYSAIKKNERMPFVATWMDLEIVILSELSETEKDRYHISLIREI